MPKKVALGAFTLLAAFSFIAGALGIAITEKIKNHKYVAKYCVVDVLEKTYSTDTSVYSGFASTLYVLLAFGLTLCLGGAYESIRHSKCQLWSVFLTTIFLAIFCLATLILAIQWIQFLSDDKNCTNQGEI